jgi:nicotinate-nucleotide adenylyltransferase
VSVRKIGLLGGTFDPIHYGHIQLAETAVDECGLDQVVFLPAAQPPHKDGALITSFKHRLAMLRLACQERKGFACNAIEGILPRPSYTIDTLQALRNHYQAHCQLYFMIGADAFLDILTWKSPREVLHSVNIILSQRKGYQSEQLAQLLKKLGYRGSGNLWYDKEEKKEIYILQKCPDALSSSAIRTMIKKGESVERFLPQVVLLYIQKHTLYK